MRAIGALSWILWASLASWAAGAAPMPALIFGLGTSFMGYFLGALCNERSWSVGYLARVYATAMVTAGGLALAAFPLQAQVYAVPVGFVLGIFGGVKLLDWWGKPPEVAPGHCKHCGYNLTGLRENRCPECGNRFRPSEVWPGRPRFPFNS